MSRFQLNNIIPSQEVYLKNNPNLWSSLSILFGAIFFGMCGLLIVELYFSYLPHNIRFALILFTMTAGGLVFYFIRRYFKPFLATGITIGSFVLITYILINFLWKIS